MYFDTKPCAVCGSDVDLRARTGRPSPERDEPVGPGDVVGGGDDTVDVRVCTNSDCPSHSGGARA